MTKAMRAYKQGYKARDKGKSYKRNPYPGNTSTRTAWNIGFCASKGVQL